MLHFGSRKKGSDLCVAKILLFLRVCVRRTEESQEYLFLDLWR